MIFQTFAFYILSVPHKIIAGRKLVIQYLEPVNKYLEIFRLCYFTSQWGAEKDMFSMWREFFVVFNTRWRNKICFLGTNASVLFSEFLAKF